METPQKLAETAIDLATVTALIDEGIKFTILAPSQALRIHTGEAERGNFTHK